jgi:nucleoside 2-deoxyribosyltransferase
MKLYLAGPEVFLPDAVSIGKVKRDLCRRYGFTGLFPLDNEVKASVGEAVSRTIFDGNIAMLSEADAVLANLTPYRGVSADAGTVFELGYAYGVGKKVFGYSNVRTPFVERVRRFAGGEITRGPDGRLYAGDGLGVEDFDRFDNLMIAEALLACGANVVIPETEPGDVWRDTRAFEQSLIVIKESVAASTRLVVAR